MKKIVFSLFILSMLTNYSFALSFIDGEKFLRMNNYKEAYNVFNTLAEQNSAISQFYLGVMYKNGYGVKQDYTEALKWFELAADQGDDDAQVYLGNMYYKGIGIEVDMNKSYQYWSQAAKQGNIKAMKSLDKLCADSPGVCK